MTREEAIMHIDGMINTTIIVKGIVPDEYDIEALRMAIEALSEDKISRAELFNKLATVNAPMEANAYKAEVYRIINEKGE